MRAEDTAQGKWFSDQNSAPEKPRKIFSMTKAAWRKFSEARAHFRALTDALTKKLPKLRHWEQQLAENRAGPLYKVETPVVFNEALNEVNESSVIKLILVADNPGRREQAAENRRYLVGPSGKIAERFFREHPELGIDFRKNVIILNKTPIHTPRTAELKELSLLGGANLASALASSQKEMAALLLEFHEALAPLPVWIIGYSEMKKHGVFEVYTDTLRELYKNRKRRHGELFFYRHFSMNQFTIDLSRQRFSGEDISPALERVGAAYRERVLGIKKVLREMETGV
jgi:hypothetical protein